MIDFVGWNCTKKALKVQEIVGIYLENSKGSSWPGKEGTLRETGNLGLER